MNKMTNLASMILMASCLSSCSEETQSVDWYIEHPEVLKEEFEKCKVKTLEELATDQHCTVIRQAQQKEFDDHQINAPLPDIKFK